jgi:hypothetical protein
MLIEVIITARLGVIEFHDCLHGSLGGRSTGTAAMEAKLAQQLHSLSRRPSKQGL